MKNIKKIGLVAICLLLIGGCGSNPKTTDGKEALVTFEKDKQTHNISVDELYQVLKNKYGVDELITMIDTYVFESEFEDYKTTAQTQAKSYLKGVLQSYDSKSDFEKQLKNSSKFSSIDEYENYIYLSYMQSHAIEEYAKSLVTEKQMKKYYDDSVKENIEVYHILITPEVKDSMSETEKTEAENKAKDEIKAIIAELNKSSNVLETFKKLAKEKSQDDETKEKGGLLGEINEFTLGTEYDELVKKAYELKDGEFTKEVVTTELGYHVVLRNATKEKESYEDLKEDILDKLANNIMASDANFVYNTMKHYRELYNMNIKDSDLDKAYRNYMNELMNTNNSSETN